MKRWPALLVAATLGAAIPHAVEGQVGLKLGVSHAHISNSGFLPGDLGTRDGITAGISFAKPGDLLGFGVEGLYTQRGAGSNASAPGFDLDYIDIPIYLRVMVPSPGLRPFAYAGPQVSFEMRCRFEDLTCPETDRAKTMYAGVIGGGVRFGGSTGLTLEGRYVYGLNDLKLSTVSDGNSYKNRSLELLVGVDFGG